MIKSRKMTIKVFSAFILSMIVEAKIGSKRFFIFLSGEVDSLTERRNLFVEAQRRDVDLMFGKYWRELDCIFWFYSCADDSKFMWTLWVSLLRHLVSLHNQDIESEQLVGKPTVNSQLFPRISGYEWTTSRGNQLLIRLVYKYPKG